MPNEGVMLENWIKIVPAAAPDYVKGMKALLTDYWADPAAMKAKIKANPKAVFQDPKYGVLPVGSTVEIVPCYDVPRGIEEPGKTKVFHLVFPVEPITKNDAERTLIAKHVIRCCAEC